MFATRFALVQGHRRLPCMARITLRILPFAEVSVRSIKSTRVSPIFSVCTKSRVYLLLSFDFRFLFHTNESVPF